MKTKTPSPGFRTYGPKTRRKFLRLPGHGGARPTSTKYINRKPGQRQVVVHSLVSLVVS